MGMAFFISIQEGSVIVLSVFSVLRW